VPRGMTGDLAGDAIGAGEPVDLGRLDLGDGSD
jgi:hypothetical protein